MFKRSAGAILAVILSVQTLPAFADHWERRGDHDHWGHERGFVVRILPPGYRTILVSGVSYLYADGLFYQYTPAGYVIIPPPPGAVVPVLPAGYTTVVVQKRPYYVWQDTYYLQAPSGGYVVTNPPAEAPVQQVSSVSPADKDKNLPVKIESKASIDTYDIYIPNDNGSYTLVTLKKSEKGFVGPQGELYPEHPTVEQLRVMYGKK